jgi:hypothetical protein
MGEVDRVGNKRSSIHVQAALVHPCTPRHSNILFIVNEDFIVPHK